MEEKVLVANKISRMFTYPVRTAILKGVDLSVSRGETVAITGRSGEGKSTLLHILGTLDKPCKGNLEVVGHDVSHFNKTIIRNHHIGFIFQSFHLLEDYTALENVLMPARIARQPIHKGSEAYKRGLDLLNKVGLDSRIHYQSKQLSGGEKQRVAIARALCNDPDLILADEPSGNLDKHNAEIIHGLLLGFVRNQNKSLIVVTHDPELSHLCDTRYELSEGMLSH